MSLLDPVHCDKLAWLIHESTGMNGMRSILHCGLLLVAATSMVGCASGQATQSSPDSSAVQRATKAPQTTPGDEGRLVTNQGVELRFDSELGVYVVVGESNLYYLSGVFYRLGAEGWAVAIQYDGPWQAVAREKLPPGLRSKALSESS